MATKRELLLGAKGRLPREVVEVPELETSFTVQGMSGKERDAFEGSCFATTANGKRRVFTSDNIRAKLLVHSIIDEDTGQLMFTENDIADIGALPGVIVNRLFEVAQRLSGLRNEDVEELAKN